MSDLPEEVCREEDQRDTHKLRNAIAFGFDVENWVRGPIGRYCAEKAEREERAFLEQLAVVDADDVKEIRRLQMEIALRKVWQAWLAEAINEGLTAQREFIEQGA